MSSQSLFWLVPAGILVVLALPPALLDRSFKRFFVGLVLSFLIVVLPLFVFGMSFFMVPEWKGAAKAGWVSCFLAGKTALTPLVLWAVAALYAVEVLRVVKRTVRWIVHGLIAGALVSTVCSLYGVGMLVGAVVEGSLGHAMFLWLLVPFYVAVWYSIRLGRVVREAPLAARDYLFAGVSSVPFWIGSVVWSNKVYASLPDQPPSCFVVTAASRGHCSLVGPFVEVSHKGRVILANRQLLTLWKFEALWRAHSPRSHSLCRSVYNVIGPAVARRIALPWLADLAYLCLKPVEYFAAAALCVACTTPREWRPNLHLQS